MQRWEYTREIVDGMFYTNMNKLGKEGWEMVAIYEGQAYFKRPI